MIIIYIFIHFDGCLSYFLFEQKDINTFLSWTIEEVLDIVLLFIIMNLVDKSILHLVLDIIQVNLSHLFLKYVFHKELFKLLFLNEAVWVIIYFIVYLPYFLLIHINLHCINEFDKLTNVNKSSLFFINLLKHVQIA